MTGWGNGMWIVESGKDRLISIEIENVQTAYKWKDRSFY